MQSKPSMSGVTRGFTLIELLIAVVVFTVVMALAIPVYQGQVRKSRRAEARALLLDAANREHRFFADNAAFTATMTDLGFPAPALSEHGVYLLSAVLVANGFTVTATPPRVRKRPTPRAPRCRWRRLARIAPPAGATAGNNDWGCGHLEHTISPGRWSTVASNWFHA